MKGKDKNKNGTAGENKEKARKVLHDKEIREPLFDFLEEVYGKTRIIEEKRMGKSRADAVMVTPDNVYGLEIRLGRQVKDYNLYYDYNYAVVGTSHALHVEEHIPEWWGIITAERMGDAIDFYVLRRPGKNPEMNWKRKMSILWRTELAHIQELNKLPAYKEKSKLFVIEKILEKTPEEILQRQFCEELFERDYTVIAGQIKEYKRNKKH